MRPWGPTEVRGVQPYPLLSPRLALYCKRRAGRAFEARERDAYLRWHTAWHLVLPGGAITGMLLLD